MLCFRWGTVHPRWVIKSRHVNERMCMLISFNCSLLAKHQLVFKSQHQTINFLENKRTKEQNPPIFMHFWPLRNLTLPDLDPSPSRACQTTPALPSLKSWMTPALKPNTTQGTFPLLEASHTRKVVQEPESGWQINDDYVSVAASQSLENQRSSSLFDHDHAA